MFNAKHRRSRPDLIFNSNSLYEPAPIRRRDPLSHPVVLALLFAVAICVLYFVAPPAIALFAAFAETATGR